MASLTNISVAEFRAFLMGQGEIPGKILKRWFPPYLFDETDLGTWHNVAKHHLSGQELLYVETKIGQFIRTQVPAALWAPWMVRGDLPFRLDPS